jgi:DNA-binding transcriptional LysR family regulator
VELRQLAVFVAVAEEMSFTRAAQRQNVVQSAISATLRTLERQLGVDLVFRTTHQVELTDAGRLLLPYARRTLAAAQETQHVLDQLTGGLRGTLRLGIMLSQQPSAITPSLLVSRFLADHPGVEVTVRTGGSGEHIEDLLRGRLDLALVALAPEDAASITLHRLHTETMGLVLPVGHRLAGRDQVELTEVADEPFVETTTSWGSRIATDRAFVRAGATRVVRYEIGDYIGVLDFVRRGLGIAISPPSLVDAGLVSVPIARYAPKLVVSIATAADRDPGPLARAMLRTARQLVRVPG